MESDFCPRPLALMASNVTLKMFANADLLAAGIQLLTQ
jgi:hypothetical protein